MAVISEFKVHEMRQRPGSEAYSASPDHLAGLGGVERDKEGGELGKEWRERKRKGGEGREREGKRSRGEERDRDREKERGEREGEEPDQVSREIDAPG